MKIQCKIIRDGGSHVDIDGVNYHFTSDKSSRHIAEVTDKAHIQRFLSISDAYQLPDDEEALTDSPLVKQPSKASGDDNNNTGASGDTGRDTSADDGEGGDDEDAEAEAAAAAERADLVAQHVAKFGTKPHHKVSNETIRAKLAGE